MKNKLALSPTEKSGVLGEDDSRRGSSRTFGLAERRQKSIYGTKTYSLAIEAKNELYTYLNDAAFGPRVWCLVAGVTASGSRSLLSTALTFDDRRVGAGTVDAECG